MYVTSKKFQVKYQEAYTHLGHFLRVGVDFETNSNVPLKDAGLGPYSRDNDLQVLMLGVAIRDNDGTLISTAFTIEDALEMAVWAHHYASLKDLPLTYAHNSGFEMAMFSHFVNRSIKIRDTAVLARIFGANNHLKWAGPQLIGKDKLTTGEEFINVFCKGNPRLVDQAFIEEHRALWDDGKMYCAVDAEVCLEIAEQYDCLETSEWDNFFLTNRMNQRGWHVDMPLVEAMMMVRDANTEDLEAKWREDWHPMNDKGKPLNLGSPVQVKKYIESLGYTTKSTDKVAMKRLRGRANLRYNSSSATSEDFEMLALIGVKQARGGSSLTKLETIQRQVCEDGRLRHQYAHCGAGQSWRTSGIGVQMQNLPRLGETLHQMELGVTGLSNTELIENFRQVFLADAADRVLLVSDLSSIEARVLAWIAWEEWKLKAIKEGRDLYKMLAVDIFAKTYDEITKTQRASGKVGELGGGYGMGGKALKDFAEKMGIELTLDECYAIITAYRGKNLRIKQLWYDLNNAMLAALQGGFTNDHSVKVGPPSMDYHVDFSTLPEGEPIERIMAGTKMLEMSFWNGNVKLFWRVWRGCYVTTGQYGPEVVYHKSPISPNHSKLWSDHTVDEETQARYTNKLYGGKLTGVLVQSFARELFFNHLKEIDQHLENGEYMVGQFHDEVVIDTSMSQLEDTERMVAHVMSNSPFPLLPVGCDVKHAYRYTK